MNLFKRRVEIRRFGTSMENGWIVVQHKRGVKQLCGSPADCTLGELRRRMNSLEQRPVPEVPGALRQDSDVLGKIATGKVVTVLDVKNIMTDYALIDAIHGPGAFEGVINTEELAVLMFARDVITRGVTA